MQYEPLLKLAIFPSVLLLVLSFVSTVLTVVYWILGDWVIARGIIVILGTINSRTGRPDTDETIIYFVDKTTDATISSGVLCLTAGVVAVIAWVMLRKPDMDSQYREEFRRFWILAVVVTTLAGGLTALASLILHYTAKGNDQYGCTSERLMMGGKMNSNLFCTREMAACNVQPKFLSRNQRANANLACNQIVAVKWIQIILFFNCFIVLAMFGVQARIRRTTRGRRMVTIPKEI